LLLNYSFSNRAPNPSELFSEGLHHSAARIELGDLRIKSESASKLSASIERTSGNWGYTVSPYLSLINNFILLEPTGIEFTLRGAYPVWSYRQTRASLLGLDAQVYNHWSNSIGSEHKFSWVRGADITNDVALINIPAAKWSNEITYKNPAWNNLAIALESQWVFEQNRHPPNITVFSPQEQQEVVLDLNTSPEAYHILSLDAQAHFAIMKTNDFTIGLRATNLLDTAYRDYLNRLRYFADDLGRNISLRLIFNY
jgi:iron complex outermembrane receptor protein